MIPSGRMKQGIHQGIGMYPARGLVFFMPIDQPPARFQVYLMVVAGPVYVHTWCLLTSYMLVDHTDWCTSCGDDVCTRGQRCRYSYSYWFKVSELLEFSAFMAGENCPPRSDARVAGIIFVLGWLRSLRSPLSFLARSTTATTW